MANRRLKGVALGAGYFAPYQYEAWTRIPEVEIVAMYNRNEARATPILAKYGVPRYYADWKAMIDREAPDFVDIITPPETHEEICRYAAERGVILADTKFEFGHADGELLLIDEVLTPDSSRYWPADRYQPGEDVPSFDKQYVREWLDRQPWDKTAPAPDLPDEIVEGTRRRYIEAYERITGRSFDDYLAGR